jgi:hypothetical protein
VVVRINSGIDYGYANACAVHCGCVIADASAVTNLIGSGGARNVAHRCDVSVQ